MTFTATFQGKSIGTYETYNAAAGHIADAVSEARDGTPEADDSNYSVENYEESGRDEEVVWTITYEPTGVAVADDRGTVAGALVTIEHPEYDTDTIEVIPPEGHTADCWLGHDGYAYPEEIWDALGEAAKAGARGESGTIEV